MTVGITRIADAEAIEPTRRDGRDRLLNGARRLLAEKGYAGMELRDVAERGKAPRGSIYHHFPGGKSQLAVEAAELEGREIRAAIESSLAELGLAETLSTFGEMFRRRVKDQPERLGCPVAAAALARPEDPALAAAATAAFESWEAPIAAALRDEGVGASRGRDLRRPRRLDDRGGPDPRPRRRRPGAAGLRRRRPAARRSRRCSPTFRQAALAGNSLSAPLRRGCGMEERP